MASVISCNRMRGSISGSSNEVNMSTYKVRYQVITDGEMGPQSVFAAALSASPDPVPAGWSTWSYLTDSDPTSFARDFEVSCDPDTSTRYYIDVTYRPPDAGEGSQTVGGDPINKITNPTLRDPVMWWDREVYTQIALKDKDGKAIVNKCQDYYPDDIELEHTRGVLVIEANYATLGEVIDLSRNYDGAVNSSTWSIAGRTVLPRCALCREVSSGAPQTEQGYTFFHVVFRFALRAGTWDEAKIETGQFHWTKKSDGSYDVISIGGNTYRKHTDAGCMVPLNDDGTRRAEDQPYVVTNWRVRPEVDFNALGF